MAGKSHKENTENAVIQNIINVNGGGSKPRSRSKPTTNRVGKNSVLKNEKSRKAILLLIIALTCLAAYFMLNPDMLSGVQEGGEIRIISR